MKCGDCKFYRREDGPFEIGQCRRYAPRPLMIPGDEETEQAASAPRIPAWPLLLPEEFCGEFVSRKERQGFV